MSHRRTHDEFVSLMNEKHPTIRVVGQYVNSITPVELHCEICGHSWSTKPPKSLIGHGCPKCGGSLRLTDELFIQRLHDISPDIHVLDQYTNANTPVLCECNHHHQWKTRPADLLIGKSCPHCAHNIRKTHLQFTEELSAINPNITAIDQYKNARHNIRFKCNLCGNVWDAAPTNVLRGSGCPACAKSKGEKRIEEYLKLHNIYYKTQYKFSDCISERMLPFDFYIPKLNIVIEYDGEQHFRPVRFGGVSVDDANAKFLAVQYRDGIKDQYCIDHNIPLIRIPYTEFDEIENILDKHLL